MIVPHEVDEVVLLTQTCDLQHTSASRYLCLVAPILAVDSSLARQARRGHRPGFAALPWLGDTRVADLSRITTLERSVLVGKESVGRPGSAQERADFAESVQRYFTRAALPDEVVSVLSPIMTRIKDRHDKNPDEGRCLGRVLEVRLEADPDLDDESPALCVLFILDEADLPPMPPGAHLDDERTDRLVSDGVAVAAAAVMAADDPVSLREAWTALAEVWVAPAVDAAASGPRVGSVMAEVLNEEELTYARSRRSPLLDLRYLSTRAA